MTIFISIADYKLPQWVGTLYLSIKHILSLTYVYNMVVYRLKGSRFYIHFPQLIQIEPEMGNGKYWQSLPYLQSPPTNPTSPSSNREWFYASPNFSGSSRRKSSISPTNEPSEDVSILTPPEFQLKCNAWGNELINLMMAAEKKRQKFKNDHISFLPVVVVGQ